MHVELEFMPGKRSYFSQVMPGVRLEWDREDATFRGGSVFFFFGRGAHMSTESTILSQVRHISAIL